LGKVAPSPACGAKIARHGIDLADKSDNVAIAMTTPGATSPGRIGCDQRRQAGTPAAQNSGTGSRASSQNVEKSSITRHYAAYFGFHFNRLSPSVAARPQVEDISHCLAK
jgi:hypothetical protein